LKVYQIPVGSMQNFTYVAEDEETSEAIVIDPSWDLEKIEEVIARNNMSVKYIVNTHHHFDHTAGNEALSKSLGAKVIQHENSELAHDISVADGEKIEFGKTSLAVFHTPGHSEDSMCLLGSGKLFSGDTLFVGSCGRVDLPGGSAGGLYHSLFDVLYNLDDDLEVLPGHDYGPSPTSTIGREKQTNLALQKRSEEDFVEMMG